MLYAVIGLPAEVVARRRRASAAGSVA
jgi:hypothetical protein